MNNDDVLQVFRDAGALLEGHFILSSGRRSPVFLQKALVFSQPELSSKLCAALAKKVTERLGKIDVVVGPAMGGVILAMNLPATLAAGQFLLNALTALLSYAAALNWQRLTAS